MLKPSKRRSEKEKIGTVLEKEVIKKIKRLAFDEGRGIGDIIQDAVLNYEKAGKSKLITRKEAVNRFCSKPFNISKKEAEKLLNEDYYEV